MSHLFYTRDLYVCAGCGKRLESQKELEKHYAEHDKKNTSKKKKSITAPTDINHPRIHYSPNC